MWILKESGYKATIAYNKSTITNNRNRARNIIWFNPSYSQNVRTLEKHSSRLIKKIFLRDHRLHKVLNKHTLNLSLSFPRVFRKTEKKNMFSVIKHHDCKVFSTKNVYRLFSNRMLLLMVNVYKHVSFTRLMPSKIKAVMSTTMLVMENLSVVIGLMNFKKIK